MECKRPEADYANYFGNSCLCRIERNTQSFPDRHSQYSVSVQDLGRLAVPGRPDEPGRPQKCHPDRHTCGMFITIDSSGVLWHHPCARPRRNRARKYNQSLRSEPHVVDHFSSAVLVQLVPGECCKETEPRFSV